MKWGISSGEGEGWEGTRWGVALIHTATTVNETVKALGSSRVKRQGALKKCQHSNKWKVNMQTYMHNFSCQ